VTAGDRFDCAVVGTCVADILVRPVALATPVGGGRLFHVDPIEVTSGGVVCNTGLGLARLGLSVAAASLVGDDPWGNLIRERLRAGGVDTAAASGVSPIMSAPAG
jgi:sugar/nucleoside kinase (ribokinase family)